jgi:hypothetical protein
MADIHKTIREVFHIRDEKDNLPIGSGQRYGRDLFPVLFAKLGFTVGAEIGVRRGKFAEKLCAANPKLLLHCVDPWDVYDPSDVYYYRKYTKERQQEIYEEAIKRLEPYNSQIGIIRKTSMAALDDFDNDLLDFVAIDGCHSFDFICPDIIFWAKKVRSGGIILCHDYQAGSWYGVMLAVNAYTQAHDIRPWYVTKETQPSAYWVNP